LRAFKGLALSWAVALAAGIVAGPALSADPAARKLVIGAWYACLFDAVDGVADQQESARSIADAAFGLCMDYEAKYLGVVGLDMRPTVAQAKTEVMYPKIIGRVMAIRAARAKLRGN
jgi:hypothetical protein